MKSQEIRLLTLGWLPSFKSRFDGIQWPLCLWQSPYSVGFYFFYTPITAGQWFLARALVS